MTDADTAPIGQPEASELESGIEVEENGNESRSKAATEADNVPTVQSELAEVGSEDEDQVQRAEPRRVDDSEEHTNLDGQSNADIDCRSAEHSGDWSLLD